MKTLVITQNIFIGAPEFDVVVTVTVPTEEDIKDFDAKLVDAIYKRLAIPVETVVKMISVGGTPVTKGTRCNKGTISKAKEALYNMFGVEYIAF